MSSNTSTCLGLLDLIQHLKASLVSECAPLKKSFHPGVMFLSLRQFDFELGIESEAALCRQFYDIIIQTLDVLDMTTIFT